MLSFHLRPAVPDDFDQLWRWRNDPLTRRMERTQAEVPREQYVGWLEYVCRSPQRQLYLAVTGEAIIGLCELWLRADQTASIGINLNPDYRGLGLATPFILAAIDKALPVLGFREVEAEIRQENIRSRRAFARAGFVARDSDGPIIRMARPQPVTGGGGERSSFSTAGPACSVASGASGVAASGAGGR